MHPLNNGSQVENVPALKPRVGTAGYFSESNDGGSPSYPGQDWFNAVIREFQTALSASGVVFDPDKFDHLQLLLGASATANFKKQMLFKGMPMSAVGLPPDPSIWLPAGRVELLRADYLTVFEIVSTSAFFTDQATIDANPRAYAGHWGNGDGVTTFTTDDWALMMNIKVASAYGVAGSTKEDHFQNITGQISGRNNTTFANIFGFSSGGGSDGVFAGIASSPGRQADNTYYVNGDVAGRYDIVSFDASNVARTSDITDTMGLFLDHFRVIPKGTFSYA
jgi:hypothetical protein